jgi:hypothetical protein
MNCGHYWEQAYEIEHHVDVSGRAFVTYLADGAKVPSPLTHPACERCDGHHIRIMRSGQVADFAAQRSAPHGEHGEPAERGERGPHRTRRSALHFLHHHREHGEPHSG